MRTKAHSLNSASSTQLPAARHGFSSIGVILQSHYRSHLSSITSNECDKT